MGSICIFKLLLAGRHNRIHKVIQVCEPLCNVVNKCDWVMEHRTCMLKSIQPVIFLGYMVVYLNIINNGVSYLWYRLGLVLEIIGMFIHESEPAKYTESPSKVLSL